MDNIIPISQGRTIKFYRLLKEQVQPLLPLLMQAINFCDEQSTQPNDEPEQELVYLLDILNHYFPENYEDLMTHDE